MRTARAVGSAGLLFALLAAAGCGNGSAEMEASSLAVAPPAREEPVELPAVEASQGVPECRSGLAVSSVSAGGRLVVLQDQSTWQVDPIDRIDTREWSRFEYVLVCPSKMTNLTRREEARVTRVE